VLVLITHNLVSDRTESSDDPAASQSASFAFYRPVATSAKLSVIRTLAGGSCAVAPTAILAPE
jgi:hypothetical protein